MNAMLWVIAFAVPVLVVISAFFSGSETALTAASKARMLQLEKSGDHRAGIVGLLIQNRERLIGALLLGNNLVNILASALATSFFLTLFGQAGVAYATVVMTLIVLVFGEVLPKTLAIGDPDRISRLVAPALRPIVAVLSGILHGFGAGGEDHRGRQRFRAARLRQLPAIRVGGGLEPQEDPRPGMRPGGCGKGG
jgi:Mg2+/Co2+ transporter CorB